MARPRLRELRGLLSEPANEQPRPLLLRGRVDRPLHLRRAGFWMIDCGHEDCAKDEELALACARASASFVHSPPSGGSFLSSEPHEDYARPYHPEYYPLGPSGFFKHRPFRRPFSLERIRLNSGGYDRGGRYWGVGEPLWRYHDNEDEPDFEINDVVRGSREEAKRRIRTKWPNARFYR